MQGPDNFTLHLHFVYQEMLKEKKISTELLGGHFIE